MRYLNRSALAALTLLAANAAPLLAETVAECEARVIEECADALEESNWLEKVAVGIVCTARLAACQGVTVTVKVF